MISKDTINDRVLKTRVAYIKYKTNNIVFWEHIQLLTSWDTSVFASYWYHTIFKDTMIELYKHVAHIVLFHAATFAPSLKKARKITILEGGKISNNRTNIVGLIQQK